VFVLWLVFSTFPAYSDPVNPTGSKTASLAVRQLRGIEREAQEAVLGDPYSRSKETQVKTSEGPKLRFQVRTADLDKMSCPENSDAISVEDKSKNFFGSTTGKK